MIKKQYNIKKYTNLIFLILLSLNAFSQDNFDNLISIKANLDQLSPKFDRSFIQAENENNGTHNAREVELLTGTEENNTVSILSSYAQSYTAVPGLGGFGALWSGRTGGNGKGLSFIARSNGGIIKFLTDGIQPENERMRITDSGNIGIGTADTKERLQVSNGDIYIEDISSGVIMKSPDGNCWKGTLDNTGILNFVATTCP